jgi:hypothetical protein
MKKWQTLAFLALAWLTGPAAVAHADVVFDFEPVTIGTATTFSYTQGGITATFSSPADPGGFAVFDSFFRDLTGHVLLDPGPSGASFIPLVVSFSQALATVSLNFATDDGAPPFSTFTLEAFSGSTLVGTVSAVGSIPPGFDFPEGTISFDGHGATFDSLRFSTTGPAPFFAVDNIAVNTPSIPEPGTLTLFALGVLGFAGYGWRRRRAA